MRDPFSRLLLVVAFSTLIVSGQPVQGFAQVPAGSFLPPLPAPAAEEPYDVGIQNPGTSSGFSLPTPPAVPETSVPAGGPYEMQRSPVPTEFPQPIAYPLAASDDAPEMPPPAVTLPLFGSFGNKGFELRTKESEFTFHFQNLTQIDYRAYSRDMAPVQDTFVIPREWLIFNGNITKEWEYYAAFAFGFDNVNLLDAFINIHYDDRLQFKIGRFKTPFTYEFYTLPIQGLIQPERSLFFNNFGINRDIGVMAHGSLFEKSVDYAFGVFNGTRNGYLDNNDAKDVMGYINLRPWEGSDSPLSHLNIGGSFDYGDQDQNPVPQVLRTNVPTTGNPIVGPEFLAFNPGVRESGPRSLGSLHAAWYYEQLSLIGEYQFGTQEYSLAGNDVGLSIHSWYVQGGYFLTGETVTARGVVKPLQNFDPKTGGCGAWELMGRYNWLTLGDEVFDDGLADPTQWTNEVALVDLGVNWYPNQYIKVAALWEHAMFDDPTRYRPGAFATTNDMFWTRLQLYF